MVFYIDKCSFFIKMFPFYDNFLKIFFKRECEGKKNRSAVRLTEGIGKMYM